MPKNWDVHHTKQHALRLRYWIERGVDVNDVTYLRGIPQKLHYRITNAQNAWWRKKVASGLYEDLDDAYARVPLEDVEAFEKQLDRKFNKSWIKAGENDIKKIKRLTKLAKALTALTAANIGALQAAEAAAKFDPETDVEYLDFLKQYEQALNEGLNRGGISHGQAIRVKDATFKFLDKYADDDAKQALNTWNNQISKSIDAKTASNGLFIE